MPSSSASSEPVILERARPLLGTIAGVRVTALPDHDPEAAVSAAFSAIAEIQSLMSAFAPDSDLTRLHAAPAGETVALHPLTRAVIAFGLELAQASDGLFDIALGGEAALRGTSPRPLGACHDLDNVQGAGWRDITLGDADIVLHRPLWLDLNGIAKGFAVDRGLAALKAAGVHQATVNIGGDLAVFGPDSETVQLRTTATDAAPQIDINDCAIASSGGAVDWVTTRHVDGRSRAMVDPRRFAVAIAPDCMTADALTKIILSVGGLEDTLLRRYGARALRWTPATGWQMTGDDDHG